eukprot:CAMPEP_0114463498 /NCGR_PEP_ID=MMETSP0104-20121206/7397_1 /TAXON_ID=37642 ORGANISM="Paraphysomonas imperforata, Strain PA2" /NCGR_SAMPLE_ID=MMETSP0104 /ASSEMBLY_ACC=CAM_ASM_000202 /LENGTH=703 /DNA_ID=CAMNT_0001636453 /DNA_START=116 /DNA_END=2227 /DNA_ORIENTATION=-
MPKDQDSNGTAAQKKKQRRKSSGDKERTRTRRSKKRGADVKILTVSWNMGNAMSDCFDRILPFQGGSYDIVALGLQESTYSVRTGSNAPAPSGTAGDNGGSGGGGSSGGGGEDDCVLQLVAQVKEVLSDDFYMVAHNKRAQMQQLIFARNDVRSRVSNIKLYAENTGFFHIFPNKGGLCVNLNVDATRLAFISCHLAAHEGVDKCAIRNSSVEEILGSVTTETDVVHHTFFMGDMNYRCTFNKDTPADVSEAKAAKGGKKDKKDKKDKEKEREAAQQKVLNMDDSDDDEDYEEGEGGEGGEALSEKKKKRLAEMNKLHSMITKEKWPELLTLDELNREIAAKRVLCGYTALTPCFPPTFKRIREIGIQRNAATSKDEDDDENNRSVSDVEGDDGVKLPSPPPATITRSTSSANSKPREYSLSMSESSGNGGALTKSFYHHKRLPSYTDRILTSSLPAFGPLLQALSFNSCEDACSSDHKPVLGVFRLTPRTGLKDIMAYSPAHFSQSTGSLHYSSSTTFRVKNLKAANLTEMDSQLFGGGSDPYCIFSADPVGILVGNVKKMKTRVINHCLNPDWDGDEINFRLATNDVKGLSRNCHFLFSVWDYDVGNPDDLIGTAAVPLDHMFGHFEATDGEDFQFELELLRNGRPQGFLSGSIEVGGMKDAKNMVAYTAKKEVRTLHDTLKSQSEAAAQNSQMGCQCVLS